MKNEMCALKGWLYTNLLCSMYIDHYCNGCKSTWIVSYL